ncbi:glycoside hydrolase family 3 protein [Lacticaseibacillus daqingensis]|uniref:glycoside hydrolase family 3 protein n=1 Tax=Lacticaseibacillus daqingensis TaxID=2486014 RepID=UPI000F790A5D|nr:glycoside hydrolase family 3 N-terminal domain-containing protein [Lacticaseibacillus daqingensis]
MKLILAMAGLLLALWLVPARPVAAATPVSAADIAYTVAQMSLDEQLGQLFISRTPATPAAVEAAVRQYHVGGLILFAPDLSGETAAQTAAKVAGWQAQAKVPLLIATDQEGGTVSRLNSSLTYANQNYPEPAQAGGLTAAIATAQAQAQALRTLGVNWNFAPVADVTTDPTSFIAARGYSASYATTAEYIRQVVPAIQATGVAATLKHFPGYGAAGDTHTGFATLQKPLAALEAEDLVPFKAGIAAGVDAVMVTHIVMAALDADHPASFSHAVVTTLLRDQLGYSGVIVTDGLDMGAITQYAQAHGQATPDLTALLAGNDAIMADDYAVALPLLKQAVADGTLPRQTVTTAVNRVLTLKQQLGLLTPAVVPPVALTVSVTPLGEQRVTLAGHVSGGGQAGQPVTVQRGAQTLATGALDATGAFKLVVSRATQAQDATVTVASPLAAVPAGALTDTVTLPAKAVGHRSTPTQSRSVSVRRAGVRRYWWAGLGALTVTILGGVWWLHRKM